MVKRIQGILGAAEGASRVMGALLWRLKCPRVIRGWSGVFEGVGRRAAVGAKVERPGTKLEAVWVVAIGSGVVLGGEGVDSV